MKCCQPGCDNEATVHLTEIIECKMKKVDLCEECAQEKGVTDPQGFALADLLLGLGASSEIEADGDPLRLMLLSAKLIAFRDTSGRVGIMDHRCPPLCLAVFRAQRRERHPLRLSRLEV